MVNIQNKLLEFSKQGLNKATWSDPSEMDAAIRMLTAIECIGGIGYYTPLANFYISNPRKSQKIKVNILKVT